MHRRWGSSKLRVYTLNQIKHLGAKMHRHGTFIWVSIPPCKALFGPVFQKRSQHFCARTMSDSAQKCIPLIHNLVLLSWVLIWPNHLWGSSELEPPQGGRAGLHYRVAGSGPVLRLLYLSASLFFSTSQARQRKESRQLGPPHHSAPAICHFSHEMKPFMKRNEFPSNEAPQKLRD